MELKKFVLLVFIIGFLQVSSAQYRPNRKLNSQLYSQLLADLNPLPDNYDQYDEPIQVFDENFVELESPNGAIRNSRSHFLGRKVYTKSLCSSRNVTVDLSNHPEFEYKPDKYIDYFCTEQFPHTPRNIDGFTNECYRIQMVNVPAGCFNVDHDFFLLQRPRYGEKVWRQIVVKKWDCQCLSYRNEPYL